MEDKINETVDVEMWGFEVDEKYYTFQYRVKRGGQLVDEGEINDDYENGNSPKEQLRDLKEEYALVLVLQRVFS